MKFVPHNTELQDVIAAILQAAGGKISSEFRLLKTLYLIDWEHCQRVGEQLTDLNWKFHKHGPYDRTVMDTIKHSDLFSVNEIWDDSQQNVVRREIEINQSTNIPNTIDTELMNSIMEKVKSLNSAKLKDLVYNTAPMVAHHQGDLLNLPEIAKQSQLDKVKQRLDEIAHLYKRGSDILAS
jgi:uncharacterized phage-associated protein